jgi:hypothetical protein
VRVREEKGRERELCLLKKQTDVRRVFDGARRRRTEEEEKEKNAKISLLPFSVSSSLLITNVSSQSNNLHNFGDHNIA